MIKKLVRTHLDPIHSQNRFFLYFVMSSLVLFFMMSCAHVVSPEGGPKDTQAPKVVSIEPENHSLYFKSRRVVLEFDELIDFKNLSEQLIISPPMDVKPDIKIKKKSIYINFDKTILRDSTTYSINFGNSVADVNEGNAIPNFSYVFSTGSYLDSMKLSGRLLDAKTRQPIKDGIVMIYHLKNNDSLPYKDRPDYFAKTPEDGKFEIKNIPTGKNKIFALKDANSDYLYNQSGEAIAFEDSMLDPADNRVVELNMFTELNTRQSLMKASSPEYGRYVFIFKAAAKGIDFRVVDDAREKKAWNIKEYSLNKDTIILWTNSKINDTLSVKLHDDEGVLRDTLLLLPVFDQEVGTRQKSGGKKNLGVSFKPGSIEVRPYFGPLFIECTHPLVSYETDKIILMEDSNQIRNFKISYVDSVRRKLRFEYKWKENTNYKLRILPSAFTDIFGLTNDTVQSKFKTSDAEQYGNLHLVLEADSVKMTQYIISLINEKESEVWTKKTGGGGSFMIEHTEPGKYRLKVIEDKNMNGIWDTGNYMEKRQPEKVLFYTEPIQVRANWDVEVKWSFKF
jgi:hypothetical protein